MTPRRPAVLAVVLTATTTVATVPGSARPPAAAGPAAGARPVQGVTLVCPGVPPSSADLDSRLVVGTSRPGEGTATVRVLAAGAPPATMPGPSPAAAAATSGPLRLELGANARTVALPAGPPVVVTATGPASGGLVVTRGTRGVVGRDRGWSLDRCTAPRTDAWFVGPSTATGQSSALHVVNADEAPAEVSVRALTRSGRVSPSSTRGRLLAPGQEIDLPLEQVAPFESALAVEVVATRGRVASSVREYRGVGAATPGGVDAVPLAERAEPVVTLAGVPGVADGTLLAGSRLRHRLTVGVPGDRDATVRVEVLDEDRRVVPVGLDAVPVPAGTVAELDLTPALTGGRASVRVSSAEGVPLVAGVLLDAQARAGDVHETLHLGATPPLVGPTVLPDARAGPDLDTLVSVTSDRRGGAPTSVVFAVGEHSVEVTVPPDRTTTVKVDVISPVGGALTLAPAPGSPPLHATAVVEELDRNGPLLGGVAVSGGLADVPLPAVRADPRVGLVDTRR